MRPIDADALEVKWFDCHACGDDCDIEYVDWRDIEKSPTIDAVPVVHGHWSTHQECSVCGDFARYSAYGEPYYSKYCPNCGAKMDGGAEG